MFSNKLTFEEFLTSAFGLKQAFFIAQICRETDSTELMFSTLGALFIYERKCQKNATVLSERTAISAILPPDADENGDCHTPVYILADILYLSGNAMDQGSV